MVIQTEKIHFENVRVRTPHSAYERSIRYEFRQRLNLALFQRQFRVPTDKSIFIYSNSAVSLAVIYHYRKISVRSSSIRILAGVFFSLGTTCCPPV